MKKGITLVSLVITIIVLLILAGITISLTIGDRGIITRAKQAGENYLEAQNHEQEMLNNLDKEFANQLNGIGGDYSSSEQSSEFRKLIAQKITSEGVETSEADTDQVIVDNIGKILQARTSDADATADNISLGKIAYVNGQKIIGNGTDYNSSEQASEFRKLVVQKITSEGVTTSEKDTDQVIVDNIGKILEARTSDADATAADIVEGKIAYVDGQKIVGNGANTKSSVVKTLVGEWTADLSNRPTTRTFDCTSINGWENLTSDNFGFLCTGGYVNYKAGTEQRTPLDRGSTMSISYDNTTGIVSISGLSYGHQTSNSTFSWTYISGKLYCYHTT